jgi:hypothetical protein
VKRALSLFCAAATAGFVGLQTLPAALAQGSHGENFSAKPAPQLFATDCTGGGCHKGPQGLGKNQSVYGLANFLREHYTNSRESASALASYLMKVPGAAAPAASSRTHPNARGSRAAVQPEEPKPETRPEPRLEPKLEPKLEAKPEPKPEAKPEPKPEAKPEPKPESKPAARLQRGRHTTAANPPVATPVSEPPQPAAAPPAPKPKHYDIFD